MSMRSRGADSVVGGVVRDLGEYRHEVCPYVGGTLTELSEILPKIIRRFLGPPQIAKPSWLQLSTPTKF